MDVIAMPSDTAAAPEPDVAFMGRRWPLSGLVLKNLVLTVLTLGIYRFWAKTAIRRYFWTNTRISGEPLEYTGRGLELFIGFLIVMAVLVPLAILTSTAQSFAGMAMPWLDPVISVLNFVVVLFLIQLAVFRMTRYRLTRTRWRGIRFGLVGKPTRYALRGFLWILSLAPSLGLTTPFMTVDLARYRVERMRFGNGRFTFTGSGKALLGPWLIQFTPFVAGLAIFIALNVDWLGAAFDWMNQAMESNGKDVIFAGDRAPRYAGVPIAGAVLWQMLRVWYGVRAFRYLTGCIGFGESRFRSGLGAGKVYLIAIVTGLIALLLLATVGVGVTLFVGGISVMDSYVGAMSSMVGFFAFLFVFAAIKTVIWRVAITRAVCKTLAVSDLAPFERVAQSAAADPRYGEGLADAFDVDAF